MLLRRQVAVINVEPGVEGFRLSLAGQLPANAVVTLGQRAIIQCQVQFIHNGIDDAFFIYKLHAKGILQRGRLHQGFQSLPALPVPALQPVAVLQGQRRSVPGAALLSHAIGNAQIRWAFGFGLDGEAPVGIFFHRRHFRDGEGLFRSLGNGGIGVRRLRVCHKAHGNEHNGRQRQQAHPEAGLAVVEHGFDALFYTDLPEGHRGRGEVGPACAALQKGRGVFLPLGKLHELDHPLVAGHFDILAQKDVAYPHQRVEPVERQGQETHHLEPVVPLFQVGPLVGQNVLPGLRRHALGDVDLRSCKPQDEGRVDVFGFPASGYFFRIPDPAAKACIAHGAVDGESRRHGQPSDGQQAAPGEARLLRGLGM